MGELINLGEYRKVSQLRKIQLAEAAGRAIVFGNIETTEAKIIQFRSEKSE